MMPLRAELGTSRLTYNLMPGGMLSRLPNEQGTGNSPVQGGEPDRVLAGQFNQVPVCDRLMPPDESGQLRHTQVIGKELKADFGRGLQRIDRLFCALDIRLKPGHNRDSHKSQFSDGA